MQTKLIVVWVAISLAGLAGFSSAVAQTSAVAVVVSEKNPVTNVSTPELRKLFAGEKHFWTGGLPVKLFGIYLAGTHGQNSTCRKVECG
jgi:hypothetical protein